MREKFDLNEMLKEIEQERFLKSAKPNKKVSQSEILDMFGSKKGEAEGVKSDKQ